MSPERDIDTLVEDQHSTGNSMIAMESDRGTDTEVSSRNETNPFRTRRQPPSFEQILAQSGLRLSDLAIVSLPNPRCGSNRSTTSFGPC